MKNSIFKTTGKILRFPVLKIIAGIIMLNVGVFIMRSIAEVLLSAFHAENEFLSSTTIFLIRILGMFFLYHFFIWIYEKRNPDEISFNKKSFKRLISGAIIGLGCIAFIVGLNVLFGWISIDRFNESPDIIKGIYYTLFYVLLQDFVYYLIIFRITEQYLGTWITILISGLIFAFKHLFFPDYSFLNGIFMFFEVTLIFSALYIKSRTLWGIFGFHAVYNFIQYIVLGNYAIEGIQNIFSLNINGPVLLTGDKSGFESSMFAVIYCIIIGGYLLLISKKEGKFIKPFWRNP